MGWSYDQIGFEERCQIAALHRAGHSIRQIAAAVDRAPSTISRELRRNASAAGYQPCYAQQKKAGRRWRGSRLDRKAALRNRVLSLLAKGWSPEQVAGRLRCEQGRTVIGCETIYRFIYAQLRRTHDWSWRLYLPRAKSRRSRRQRAAARLS